MVEREEAERISLNEGHKVARQESEAFQIVRGGQ
jgi:hypothetical protein